MQHTPLASTFSSFLFQTFWPINFLSPIFCSCIFVRLIPPVGSGLNMGEIWQDFHRHNIKVPPVPLQPGSPTENQQDIICPPRFIWILIYFAPENKLYSSGDSFPSRNRECNLFIGADGIIYLTLRAAFHRLLKDSM